MGDSIRAESAGETELRVFVALVCFDAAAFNIVPESDARVECPCQNEFSVWGEARRGYGRVILVDKSSKALAG